MMTRQRMWSELRPALLCLSTILLLLGTVLTLVALLAIALRAPASLYIYQIDDFRSVVIGGEGFGVGARRVLHELGTAVLLTLIGAIGVLSIRPGQESGYGQLN
jgi:hypothetical protein